YSPGSNRYQFAYDSIRLKQDNAGNYYPGSTAKHPQNQLWQGDGGAYDDVFSKADRINAYQHGMRDSINTIRGHANAGVSISYSGALQENIGSLGRASYGGYYPAWNQPTAEARGWTTSTGHPRADLVGMTYHHSFSPLLPESVLRKEIAIFRDVWWKSWSGNPDKSDHSRGFWPIECAFSRHMIPVLREFGYEWVIVANSHLARTCENYLDVAPSAGTNTWNNVPPNRADRLGPAVPVNQWWSSTIDGRGGTFPAPYAYQAHKAQYVDPDTGAEETIVVVPMCDQLSYQNGFGNMGTGEIDNEISPFATDPAHPCIVLMAHDGDNAWGGGNSYYFESVPGLMNAVSGNGYQPSTIEHYLGSLDRNNLDVVHVEDGTWVNADDRGSPGFYHWLFPPQRDRGSPAFDGNDPKTFADFETPGFSEDFRSWAIIVAGANYLETAEQLWTGAGGSVLAWKIQEPTQVNGTDNNPNFVEQGWHYYLGGLDSGFLYYGSSLDDEMKSSLAQRRALDAGDGSQTLKQYVDGHLASDLTAPTVFKPQRYPWNPGGKDWGNHIGYRKIGFDGVDPWESEFFVWSHIFDVSGVQSATLRIRVDADGVNPVETTANEVYAGGTWISVPMTKRSIDPAFNPDRNPGDDPGASGDINFFIQPHVIADYYYARVDATVVPGIRDSLLDYYVEAVDGQGNVSRSEIQHVYVEDDGGTTGGGSPPPTPADPAATASGSHAVLLTWSASAGAVDYVLRRGGVEIGASGMTDFTDSGLSPGSEYCYTVEARNASGVSAPTAAVCATTTGGGGSPAVPFTMDGTLDSAGYLLAGGGMELHAAVRGGRLYVATGVPANGNDHFIMIGNAALPSATQGAPWAKAGFTALPAGSPFLGAESTNNYLGWSNTGTAGNDKFRGGAGQVMEGEIDYEAVFGSVPATVCLAALAYETPDAAALAGQAPAGDADGDVDPAELRCIPLEALRDEDASGVFDRLEAHMLFEITSVSRDAAGTVTIGWNCFPGRRYAIECSGDLAGWTTVAGSEVTAGPGDLTTSTTLSGQSATAKFFRVKQL
ncbi:MAG: hypothetical protein HKO57_14180, partial [Akkermansiaceae bacterium]|nr:hypothetical protein [Akkermansiaceae bacterium]